jgi:O-acetyl-ADP-ribose deacetylase (regulator of RNase III)
MLFLTNYDITQIKVDAIVNAANTTLLGGGGVDGCIHIAAGERLLEECRALGGCAVGDAKITSGYDLPARHIIHVVGPVYEYENGQEETLLANCYRRALEVASEHNITSIAFPQISTGAFRFPKDRAAEIAISTVTEFLAQQSHRLTKIVFVSLWKRDKDQYREAFTKLKVPFQEVEYWEL